MAMLLSDASEASKPKRSGMRMEKCLLGQQELDVPETMMEDVRFLCFIVSCQLYLFIIKSWFYHFRNNKTNKMSS